MQAVGAVLRRAAPICFMACGMAGPALARPVSEGGWFTHPFGEARSYHRDWLAVCGTGSETGSCRVVHYIFAPGDSAFFGSARVAVHRVNGGYSLEFWDETAAMTPRLPLDLRFDGAKVRLDAPWVFAGGHDGLDLAQTLSVTEPTLTATLVALMRVADRLDMTLDGSHRRVSLLGFGAALEAITHQQMTRDEHP